MTRPRRPLENCTVPARAAKIVSSLPRPTPSPGLKRVPRWRTMISPPLTTWPANTFTPSLWAFESRPLRLDPRSFLGAILVLLRLLCRAPAEELDLADLEPRQVGAVPLAALVAALRLELEHVELAPALVPGDDGLDLHLLEVGT